MRIKMHCAPRSPASSLVLGAMVQGSDTWTAHDLTWRAEGVQKKWISAARQSTWCHDALDILAFSPVICRESVP